MSIFEYIKDPPALMLMLAIRLITIIAILPIHEYAHALAAKKMGDNTAIMNGRLTLNPLAHIDVLGALLLIFFGFGWAKPVPIISRNFKDYKKGIIITAAAGPFSNLLCATAAALILRIINNLPLTESNYMIVFYIALAFEYFIIINLSLAVFNLLPIHPLDGSRIIGALLPPKANFFMYKYQQYISIAVLVLIISGVLSTPMNWIINHLFDGIYALFFWVDMLFGH